MRGLSRKPPVAAKGQLKLSGNAGASFAAGLKVRLGEQLYTTQAAGQLDADGQGSVAVAADLPGLAGNRPAGAVAELMAAPSGLASRVSFVSMDGGVDEEDDAALLARLLELIRRPPAGGNRHDYRRWALEVPGVSAAYVYPLRRGLGTVDVVITARTTCPRPIPWPRCKPISKTCARSPPRTAWCWRPRRGQWTSKWGWRWTAPRCRR